MAIFGPIYAYLAFSWTQCLDGSCSSQDTAQYMVIAVVTFVFLLLLAGVSSAIKASRTLRQAEGSAPARLASGGLDTWLSIKLLIPAIAGGFVLFALL